MEPDEEATELRQRISHEERRISELERQIVFMRAKALSTTNPELLLNALKAQLQKDYLHLKRRENASRT